jgi:hypothetical protein
MTEENKPDLLVIIGMPTGEDVKAHTHRCITKAILRFGQTSFVRDGVKLRTAMGFLHAQGSMLPALRESIARRAMVSPATHLLWIDSDMTFPDDTIERLIKADKDVIGANCPRKMMPTMPTCKKAPLPNGILSEEDMWTLEGSTGLERTSRIGFGILMTKMHVYHQLSEPLFPFSYDYQCRGYDGEDTNFCRNLHKHGFEMWVDHDLSKQIGHVGSFEFEHGLSDVYWGKEAPPAPEHYAEVVELRPVPEKVAA